MTTGSSLRIGEAILGGVVLGLGLFIAIETSMLEVAASNAAIGPRVFPFLIAAGLLIVGALVLRQAFFGHIAHEGGFEALVVEVHDQGHRFAAHRQAADGAASGTHGQMQRIDRAVEDAGHPAGQPKRHRSIGTAFGHGQNRLEHEIPPDHHFKDARLRSDAGRGASRTFRPAARR